MLFNKLTMAQLSAGLQLASKFFSTPITTPENVTADSVLAALGALAKDKKEVRFKQPVI